VDKILCPYPSSWIPVPACKIIIPNHMCHFSLSHLLSPPDSTSISFSSVFPRRLLLSSDSSSSSASSMAHPPPAPPAYRSWPRRPSTSSITTDEKSIKSLQILTSILDDVVTTDTNPSPTTIGPPSPHTTCITLAPPSPPTATATPPGPTPLNPISPVS
jgi:hypothetical protein